jgi:hypothetical protein
MSAEPSLAIDNRVYKVGNSLLPNDIGNTPLFCCPYSALKISPGILVPRFKNKARLGPFMAQGGVEF